MKLHNYLGLGIDISKYDILFMIMLLFLLINKTLINSQFCNFTLYPLCMVSSKSEFVITKNKKKAYRTNIQTSF